jgi:hypothetical protein
LVVGVGWLAVGVVWLMVGVGWLVVGSRSGIGPLTPTCTCILMELTCTRSAARAHAATAHDQVYLGIELGLGLRLGLGSRLGIG